ncbi:GNAT family N-acetyltransferase [Streptomyces sp. NPDC050560]|uniref:GNAT family N-acetyltransferase n=1 Tax=Streptomyces sp. NPDC050560 TaxID=3365630 RepID=UPI0037A26D0B
MRLRDVAPGDVEAYARMRCDPVMMAELGGPLPRSGIEEKVARDLRSVADGSAWIKMIIPEDGPEPGGVAGSVVLWRHTDDADDADAHDAGDTEPAGRGAAAGPGGALPAAYSEIGWMVLPGYQGRGLAKRAVRALLAPAAGTGRWGVVHALPGVGNAASNAVCRSLGFTRHGTLDVDFAGRTLRSRHWSVDSRAGLPPE